MAQNPMGKVLTMAGMSNSGHKPDAPICEHCGEEKKLKEMEHPIIKGEMRWVPIACECEIKAIDDFREEQKQKEKQNRIRKILKLSSELDDMRSKTFDNFIDREGTENAKKAVLESVENFESNKKGLFIFGETGNGKTHLTSAGGNELIKKGYAVIFITEKDLFKRLEATKNFRNEESFQEIMSACMEADLLIWDDFFSSQKLSPEERDYIFQITNGRERSNKPIWFTSNLTPDEMGSDDMAFQIDDRGRTWWRILSNTKAVYNRGKNRRKATVMAEALGVSLEDYEQGNY